MDIAQVIATAGTCSRLKVGAVLVRDRRIISTGYNGAPARMTHCQHASDPAYDQDGLPGGGGCKVSVHAEANAITFAAKHGITTQGASLYTTDSPCQKCAELIVNAGIMEVIYEREYRTGGGLALLQRAQVHIAKLDGSELRTVSIARGYQSSMPASEPSDPAFEQAWTEQHEGKHQAGGNW